MHPDIPKLTAGLLLAESPGLDEPVVQYGLVGLIAWMVIRECFSLIRMLLDRKKRERCDGLIVDENGRVLTCAGLELLKKRVRKLEEERE